MTGFVTWPGSDPSGATSAPVEANLATSPGSDPGRTTRLVILHVTGLADSAGVCPLAVLTTHKREARSPARRALTTHRHHRSRATRVATAIWNMIWVTLEIS